VASAIGKLVRFASSPAGRRLLAGAQKAARDPRTRARLEALRRRLQQRR
jgi:hypothetical protein